MRWTALVAVILLGAGCAYHAPTAPSSSTPAPSNSPASIRVTLASRTDRQFDLTATVLTADGHFVPSVPVAFAIDTGTVTPAAMQTNANGQASTIVATSTTTTVTISSGALSTTTSVTGVPAPTSPPPPVYTPTPEPTPVPLTVTIYATPGVAGTATTFSLASSGLSSAAWTFGDGTSATTSGATSHVYASAATYPVGVTVTDTLGRSASTTTSVTIAAPAAPTPTPASTLGVSLVCTPVAHGAATPCNVTVTYGGVTLPSAKITNVDWDWGDGSTTTTALPVSSRTYVNAGTYIVFATVTATTTDGAKTATTSKAVIIL